LCIGGVVVARSGSTRRPAAVRPETPAPATGGSAAAETAD